MGGCGSKPDTRQGASNQKGGPKKFVKVAQPARPPSKVKPEDLIISKKQQQAIIKEEGTIDGNQFNIEECQDCDIFLLDNTATVYVDECERCRIFIGPCESSVFIRNCRDCSIQVACQQFRSRDCANCKFGLFCTTEPIIETSTDMLFGCFDFSYFSLRQQMGRARLKLWNNKWWQVYDFNSCADRPNWSLMPQEDVPNLLNRQACGGTISAEEMSMDRIVPVTLGNRPRPHQESCFVVFLPDSDSYIEEFLMTAARSWALARTRCAPLNEERVKQLFAWGKDSKLIAQCKGKELTGIEVCSDGVHQAVQELVSNMAAATKCIRIVPAEETQRLARDFFETWKDEV